MTNSLYTTRSGASVLGIKQDTLKHYAIKYSIGSQPGGPGTPWIFTLDDLKEFRRIRSESQRQVKEVVQIGEDREELGLGPLYNSDMSPRS